MTESRRAEARLARDVRRETLVGAEPELGLVAMASANDPEPSLVVEDGRVVEMDGRPAADFDVIDRFIAEHGLDLDVAAEAMALSDAELARSLVDVDVPRQDLVRLSRGLTPARLARVAAILEPVEMMFALKRLRARRRPANQAHVTNRKENPALLAADAAEAAARGFAEVETTVGVARYAPLNAIAILVGAQVGRPGVITQCSVEERRNLQLGIQGLTTYSETLSVYGTEPCFVDGDDTPWSKAFLASAYASRGIKVRFTSGAGAEALMGHAQGCSMLYLEARCLCTIRAAGAQGVQNGGISTVALAMAVPAGTREILAENLLAAWLDLEVASGNDAISSHSEIRKTAKLMGQFLPGTDFVTSGYSVMPRYDNMFGGGNYDADDIDDWLTIQRDWQVDAGLEPLAEEDAVRFREKRCPGGTGRVRRARLPRRSPTRRSSSRRPATTAATSPIATGPPTSSPATGCSMIRSRRSTSRSRSTAGASPRSRRRCSACSACALSADYLQTSAIVSPSFEVESAVNDPNEYSGPGHRLQARGRALATAATAAARARRAWLRGRRRPRRPPRRARRRGRRHRA